jgi:Holliday junction resolvase
MSNKSVGTQFERAFAEMLAARGFWAHCMKDNKNGQPFDVIAAKDGEAYVFDCKDCQGDAFQLSRIEENQHNAMTLWEQTGNHPGLFAIRFGERIYLVPHRMLIILRENGTKQIKLIEAAKYGQELGRWLDKRVHPTGGR